MNLLCLRSRESSWSMPMRAHLLRGRLRGAEQSGASDARAGVHVRAWQLRGSEANISPGIPKGSCADEPNAFPRSSIRFAKTILINYAIDEWVHHHEDSKKAGEFLLSIESSRRASRARQKELSGMMSRSGTMQQGRHSPDGFVCPLRKRPELRCVLHEPDEAGEVCIHGPLNEFLGLLVRHIDIVGIGRCAPEQRRGEITVLVSLYSTASTWTVKTTHGLRNEIP